MRAANPSRPSVTGLILALAVTLAAQSYLWPHVTDDAYISFRYADRLAHGAGLTFNDGERVEGFSNPLWTVALAGIAKVTALGLPDIARALGLACALATILLAWWGMRFTRPACTAFSSAVALTLIVTNPGFHIFATAGLEGPLFGCLLLGGVVATLSGNWGGLVLAAAAFALAGVTRPEGLMYGLFWFIALRWVGRDSRLSMARQLLLLAIVLLPAAVWECVRLSYYGSWLPNSAIAKSPGTLSSLFILPSTLQPWILSLGGPLILLSWVFVRAETTEAYRRLWRAAAGVIVAGGVFVLYTCRDWMPFGRFIVPVWPVIAMLSGVWLDTVLERLRESGALRLGRSSALVVLLGVVACAVFAWQVQVRGYVANEGMNMQMRGSPQVAAGEWLAAHLHKGATVATPWLGGMGYVAKDLVFWDLAGLTDVEQARYVAAGEPGGPDQDPILRRQPDAIVALDVPASWGYKNDRPLYDWIDQRYVFVRAVPQGKFGAVDIWILRERMNRILRADTTGSGS